MHISLIALIAYGSFAYVSGIAFAWFIMRIAARKKRMQHKLELDRLEEMIAARDIKLTDASIHVAAALNMLGRTE